MLKVSVIILTYNNLQYLNNAIESLLMQSYPNIEIIIHDDCSIDFDKNTILQLFENNENRFTNIIISKNETNFGTVRNYNEAIKKATGDIIVPLACDDVYIDENVISDIVTIFEEKNCDVCCAFGKGAKSGKLIPEIEFVQTFRTSKIQEQKARILYGDWYMFGAATYYKHNYLKTVNGFDERFRLIEDYPANIRMIQTGANIFFSDRITILYGEDGVSSSFNKKKNSIITDDLVKIYELLILPEMDLLTKKQKRMMAFTYERLTCSGVKKLFLYLKYFDCLAIKIYKRLLGKIQHKAIDEFELLKDR